MSLRLIIYTLIAHVVADNDTSPTRLSLMPEATYSIEHPILCAPMLEVIKMVACPTVMSHMSKETRSSSAHSQDYHMNELGSLT